MSEEFIPEYVTVTLYNQSTGKVEGSITDRADLLHMNVPEGSGVLYGSMLDGREYYVSEGLGQLRPGPYAPTLSGNNLTFSLPVVSTVSITNEDGDKISFETSEETIELLDIGNYVWQIVPPFPHKASSGKVTIE